MGVSPQYLIELFDRMKSTPIEEIMRADERVLGNEIIYPGDAEWLPKSEWHRSVVISKSGSEVRLIAILALRPGHGSFRRMIDGIQSAGLTPVILAPSSEMRATLKRWGWLRRDQGRGLDLEEQWRPSPLSAGIEARNAG